MNIKVTVIPNCTWELEDNKFYCTHDEFEIETFIQDHLGADGHYQTETVIYVCSDCGEIVEGPPEDDMSDEEYERLREY